MRLCVNDRDRIDMPCNRRRFLAACASLAFAGCDSPGTESATEIEVPLSPAMSRAVSVGNGTELSIEVEVLDNEGRVIRVHPLENLGYDASNARVRGRLSLPPGEYQLRLTHYYAVGCGGEDRVRVGTQSTTSLVVVQSGGTAMASFDALKSNWNSDGDEIDNLTEVSNGSPWCEPPLSPGSSPPPELVLGVVSSDPAAGAENVDPTGKIQVQFSQRLLPENLQPQFFTLSDDTGIVEWASVELSSDGLTATLISNGGWREGVRYTVSIDERLEAFNRASLPEPHSFSFSTIPANRAPTAVINGPIEGPANEILQFSGTDSQDPDGSLTSYRWSFGDGTEAEGPEVGHAFAPGTYTVTLTVTDGRGASDVESLQVVIVAGEFTVFQDVLSGDSSLGPKMVALPPGRFLMGSTVDEGGHEAGEEPQHPVTIKRSFALSQFELTVGDFERFVNATAYETDAEGGLGCRIRGTPPVWAIRLNKDWRDPDFAQTPQSPVTCISWNDAQQYISWLNEQTGKVYRLPTEAEWEYAARAGSTSARFWGNNPDRACTYANVKDVNNPSSSAHNCDDGVGYGTAKVGSYGANAFYLYDMLGNVMEWTADCWHENYQNAPVDGSAWLDADGGDCNRHVVRGGTWDNTPISVRSAKRTWELESFISHAFGIRLARDL